jgi:hypothetical protein
MVWAVWVFWRIRIGMMHSVQNCVRSWREIRTALPNPGEEVEEFFPKFIHHKHLVSSVSMQEETLTKQGEIPMKKEEDNDNHVL